MEWFRCDQCSFKTQFSGNLTRHLRTINCSIKNEGDYTSQTFKKTKVQGINWLQCKQCSFKTQRMSNLKVHIMAKHTGHDAKQWIKCEYYDYCLFRTVHRSSLIKHIKRKHSFDGLEQIFKCKHCHFTTKYKSTLTSHLLTTHIKAKQDIISTPATLDYNTSKSDEHIFQTMKCVKCAYGSQSTFFMKNHVMRHTLNMKPFNCKETRIEPFLCNDCQFSTYSNVCFNQHIQTSHKECTNHVKFTGTKYKCKFCLFHTYSMLLLLKHRTSTCQMQRGALHERSFIEKDIDLFDKEFKETTAAVKCKESKGINWRKNEYSSKTLYVASVPNPIKPQDSASSVGFECYHCQYKSRYKASLKQHIIQLHNMDDASGYLYCDLCDYQTRKASTLIKHVGVTHAFPQETWWYQCHQCDIKYTSKMVLEKHIFRTHRNGCWFSCDKCDYATKRSDNLKKHMRRKH